MKETFLLTTQDYFLLFKKWNILSCLGLFSQKRNKNAVKQDVRTLTKLNFNCQTAKIHCASVFLQD